MKLTFTSHKQYLLGYLFSRNTKKTHTDQSTVQVFLHCLKKNTTHKSTKVATAKIFTSSAHVIDTTCVNECFLFHFTTGIHSFFVKVCRYFEIISAVIL